MMKAQQGVGVIVRSLAIAFVLACMGACGGDGSVEETSGAASGGFCDLKVFEQKCYIGCPNGYESDQTGCPYCRCGVFPEEVFDNPACHNLTCPQRCETYVVTDAGCSTCECGAVADGDTDADTASSCDFKAFAETCGIICPVYGYVTDDNGCSRCKCATPHGIEKLIADGECPVLECKSACTGYIQDEKGCRCSCP